MFHIFLIVFGAAGLNHLFDLMAEADHTEACLHLPLILFSSYYITMQDSCHFDVSFDLLLENICFQFTT